MKQDPLSRALVESIIGDIGVVWGLDDDEFDASLDEVANMTEAEWDALEAEWDALPQVELTPEQEAWCAEQGREIRQYIKYMIDMTAHGSPYLDIYEWRNMNPKPAPTENS